VPTGGNYFINGGTGAGNTLDLSLLPSYSTLNLESPAPQQLGAGNGSVTVVAGTIQKVIASPSGSTLQAGPSNITLVGTGPGNDMLEAGTGTQTLIAGTGDDTLVGGIGTDNLKGGASPVTFVPGEGSDTLTTQLTSPGNTLSYQGAPAGAEINLSGQLVPIPQLVAIPNVAPPPFAGTLNPNQAIGGWGATVSLSGAQISQVIGSSQADLFVTGSTPESIFGNGGNDLFLITSGGNTLTAGANSVSRFVLDAPGINVINGNGGSNAVGHSIVDFSLAPGPTGVVVNLQQGAATGGFGGSQSLSGIQMVVGTNYPDTLVAGASGQTLIGLKAQVPPPQVGGDSLVAAPVGGDTLMSDGNGDDTFCAQSSCNGGQTVTGGNTMMGGTGIDTFYAVNSQVDTIQGGSGGALDNAYVDQADIVTGIPPNQVHRQ
jgi:Ca2+-binding RTX toxin-like protein